MEFLMLIIELSRVVDIIHLYTNLMTIIILIPSNTYCQNIISYLQVILPLELIFPKIPPC